MMIYDMLWEPQKQAVDFIVNQRRVLLADQPGSGKTLMSLAALEVDGCFTNGITLILAPKFPAKTTWLKAHVTTLWLWVRGTRSEFLTSLKWFMTLLSSTSLIGFCLLTLMLAMK